MLQRLVLCVMIVAVAAATHANVLFWADVYVNHGLWGDMRPWW
jgi:hypothetical protein